MRLEICIKKMQEESGSKHGVHRAESSSSRRSVKKMHWKTHFLLDATIDETMG
jgi:hypothetical protein